MFLKQNRLKRKKDFERIFKKGKSVKQDLFLVKYMENGLELPRIGIVISKKVCPRAVERNLIKRRMREIIRKRIEQLGSKDIVIIALSGINKNIEFSKLENIIDNILEKL